MSAYAGELTDWIYGLALVDLVRRHLEEDRLAANPAAGADWTLPVDAGESWEILAVNFTLTASAAVANRSVKLRGLDGNGNEVFRIGPQAVQTAGQVVVYTYLPGQGYAAGVDGQQLALGTPPPILPPGYSLASLTGAIDVGDQFSKIAVSIRRWSPQRVALACGWVGERPRTQN